MRYTSDYFSECDKCGKIISYRNIEHFTRRTRIRCQQCYLQGKANPQWKGDNVGYGALHSWVRRHKPKPFVCEICKIEKPFDVANISGKYKRDTTDFQWLCRRCHVLHDLKIRK